MYSDPRAYLSVLYMLLALGLNVVVGWGGLLDLGFGLSHQLLVAHDDVLWHSVPPLFVPVSSPVCGRPVK